MKFSDVLPSTEFGYPSADGNKIRLLGDSSPNTPWKRPPPECGRKKGVFKNERIIVLRSRHNARRHGRRGMYVRAAD